MPIKDPHTHQKKTIGFGQRPRPLHDRHTRTDNFVRWGIAVAHSRCKFVTVSLRKRPRDGRFTSETAVRVVFAGNGSKNGVEICTTVWQVDTDPP
jgi:hypothetical protein